MSITVRQAQSSDRDEVTRLWAVLVELYGRKADPALLQGSYHRIITGEARVRVFIILRDGVVAGTASLHLGRLSTWHDNYYGHIEDLIIDPAQRGRGLARLLMTHILEAAREEGLARLELTTRKTNHKAQRLYEELGFTNHSLMYEIDL